MAGRERQGRRAERPQQGGVEETFQGEPIQYSRLGHDRAQSILARPEILQVSDGATVLLFYYN